MTEQQLDRAHVGAGFEQVRGKRMAQRMRRDGLADAGTTAGVLAGLSHYVGTNGLVGKAARKQPVLGPADAPVTAQDLQQPWREHHVAVGVPLALFDP